MSNHRQNTRIHGDGNAIGNHNQITIIKQDNRRGGGGGSGGGGGGGGGGGLGPQRFSAPGSLCSWPWWWGLSILQGMPMLSVPV